MGDLESLTDGESIDRKTVNHWIDSTHNVFAFINVNSDDDSWIEIHFELYDSTEKIIGDITTADTETVSLAELESEIKSIVDIYLDN